MWRQRAIVISRLRIASATLVVLLVALALALGVRALPHGHAWDTIAFLAGFVVTPIIGSLLEWLVHRHVYHRSCGPFLRRIYSVHQAHHYLYFPTWRYVTAGPARRIPIFGRQIGDPHTSLWGNLITRGTHFGFYLMIGITVVWMPAWFITASAPFLLGIGVASLFLSNLFVTVHDAIHRPRSHRILQAQPWFQFLDEHHYIHHVDNEANVNFLLPLADWLFGTLRRSLTAEELARHGPRESAKQHPRGAGEPASGSPALHRPAMEPGPAGGVNDPGSGRPP